MATSAVVSNGTTVQVGTATGSAKTITAIALGNPTLLTSSAHGFTNGDIVTLAAAAGADAATLNGQTVVIRNKTANTFAVDIDTTGKTITATAGTATPVTWTTVANVNTFSGIDGSTTEIDATNLASVAKEVLFGLPDSGGFTINLDQDDTDAGQIALRTAYQQRTLKSFKVTFPNNKALSFSGYVKKYGTSGGVDKVMEANCEIRITGAYTLA